MMRMKRIWTLVLLAALAGAAASSCGKDEPTPVTPEKPDTPVTPDPPKPKVVDYDKYALRELAEKAGLKLGVSFTYGEYQQNPKVVAEILKRDFAAVTFGNEMKHDAIVLQGGAYNFTRADQMAGWAKACGTELFGHTLGWHSQQQRTYLNNLISKAARNNGASLLQRNWNFEAGTLDGFQADGFEIFQSLYDVFAGDYAAKAGSDGATLTVDASLEAGKPYTFSCWAKTLAKEGSLGVTSGDGQSAQTKVSGQWFKYDVPFTLESPGDFAFRITASKDVVIDNVRILGEVGGGQQPAAEVIDFEGLTAGPLNSPDISAINGADYVRVTGETAHGGSLSLKMDNSSGYAQNAWSIQVLTKSFAVTPGTTYRLSWYAKAGKAADFQIDVRGDGDVKYFESKYNSFPKAGTDWTYQSVEFTVASGTELSFAFYGGVEAVTYYLDDIRLAPASAAASAPRRRAAPAFSAVSSLNGELVNDVIGYVYRDWVYTMVGHFDAYGWDVVNETFSDWPAGAFRTPQNTSGEVFVWGQYFKSTKDWVDKAFAYATDALARNGKTAVLYLNDYNLETSADKRKAYCDYVKGNPQVTGVGTQMHLDMATPDLKNLIVASLTDLKNTGRLVRISELDIKCTDLTAQADLYKFIFQQYLEIVPAAQRGGITIWGINDRESWVKEENMPLLYQGVNYARKPAWNTLYLYLCELAGLDPYKE
jgi:Beta-1,4-xylanase